MNSPNEIFKFKEKIVGNFDIISPENIRDKISLHEQFKQKKMQHYFLPDSEKPMKVVARGLRRYLDMNMVK